MANYDGEVIINTQIDDADYQQTLNGYKMGAQDLSNHIQQMTDKVKNLTNTQRAQLQGMVSKFNEQNSAYATQEAKIESLKQKWYSLYNIEKQITSVENQMKVAKDKLASGNLNVNEYMALQDKLKQLESEYNDLIAKKKQAFGSANTEGLGASIDKEQAKLDSMGNRLTDTFNRINAKVQDYQSKSVGASGITGKLSSAMSTLGRGVTRVGSGIGSLASRGLTALKNKFVSAKDSAQGFATKLAGNFKTILKYAVGLGTLRRIAGYLRNSLKDGITAMANADAQTRQSINNIKASVNGLKASLGSALAPLINAIAPAVTYIVNMVTKAIHYVGMLISAFTGKKTYKMATPINNTAKALDKNTSATNKNTKATKKNTKAKKKQNKELQRYLSGLDEMAIWEEKHKDLAGGKSPATNSPNSIGSSGSGGNSSGLQVSLDEVKIPKSIRKLADTIKEYIKKGDWKGLGTFIGKKIETALDNIPWGNIQKTTGKIAANVASFLNGIFGNKGLAWSVGRTVGEALNTILNIGYNFLKTFNFKKFGTFIGNALKSAIKTFDWVKLGKTFGKSLKAIKDTINGFWDGYDAGDFASGLAGAINTALDEYNDGEGMGKALGRTLQGVATEAVTFMADLDWSELGGDIGDTIWGFFKGFFNPNSKEAKNMFTKFQNFINGGKNGNIWEKILGNNTKIDRSRINPVTGSMGKVLDEVGKLFGGVTVKADTKTKDLKKKVKKNMEDTAKESKNALKGMPTFTGNTYTDAWNNIKTAFNQGKTKGWFDGIWGKIKGAFTSVKTWFGEKFSGAWGKVKSAFTGVKNWFTTNVWGKIKSAFANTVGWFKKKFSDVWSAVKSPFVSVGKWFKEHVIDKIAGVFTGKDGIKQKIEDAFSGIKGILKGVVNKIITGLNWMIDKAVGLINGLASIYNATIGKLPKTKKFSKLKASNYHIPKLATGSVIPPNKEFLAVLGDQKHGTNIETPEDLLRQIVAEESGSGSYKFIAQINRKTLFDQVIDEAKLRKKQTGQNAFANI